MSASAVIAKRRVQVIASSFKIQNNNSTLSTLTAFRGAQGCPPLNYNRIRYFKPNCRYPCILPPITCIPAGDLDGGIVGVNTVDGGGPSGYSAVWDGGSPGHVGTTVYDGNTEENQFASGGSPEGVGVSYDGGSPTHSGNTVYDGGNTVTTGATSYSPTYTFDGGDPFQTGACIYDGGGIVEACVTASGFDGGQPSSTFNSTFDGGSSSQAGLCVYDGNQNPTCLSASGFDGGQPSSTFIDTFDGGSGYSSGQCVYTGGSA